MNTKQLEVITYLNKAFHLEKNITALVAVHESNISLAERCTANYQNTGAGKSINNENGQENIIHKIIDLSDKINKEIDKLIDIRNEIAEVINNIDNPESKAILTRRYLLYQSMQEIADTMSYSLSTVQRKHKQAIKSMENNVDIE